MDLNSIPHSGVLAAVVAFVSASTFGFSTSLQHRVAENTDAAGVSGLCFLARLARRPSWVLGIGLSVTAFALHAVAVGLGALALVQPIIVSGVVVAVLARAALERHPPSAREAGWAAFTWAGLSVFMIAIHPGRAPQGGDQLVAALLTGAGALAAGACVRLADRTPSPQRRGLWLGCSAGISFGLVAGLLKLTIDLATTNPLAVVTQWPPWAMVAVGLWAMTMNQRAYHATRLSVSMPVLNIVDVVVALAFAAGVFGEHLVSSGPAVAAGVLGLAMMGVGVGRLARLAELAQAPRRLPSEPVGVEEAQKR